MTDAVELLVVEGNADTAESLQLLLEAMGYVVQVALDARTALTLVGRRPIALAFIAIALPDLDGYTLARRMRTGGSGPILIALTGYGRADDRARARDAGFDDHILKPATVDQLEEALARHLSVRPH